MEALIVDHLTYDNECWKQVLCKFASALPTTARAPWNWPKSVETQRVLKHTLSGQGQDAEGKPRHALANGKLGKCDVLQQQGHVIFRCKRYPALSHSTEC